MESEGVEERIWIVMGVINLGVVLEYGKASGVIRNAGGLSGAREGTILGGAGVRMVVKRATIIVEDDESSMDFDGSYAKLGMGLQASRQTLRSTRPSMSTQRRSRWLQNLRLLCSRTCSSAQPAKLRPLLSLPSTNTSPSFSPSYHAHSAKCHLVRPRDAHSLVAARYFLHHCTQRCLPFSRTHCS